MNQITEAQIYLTRRCNLRCSYCKLTKTHLEELSLEEWKRGYDNLKQIGIKTVKLLGGEPTLKRWLPELISYTNRLGIKTALLSNSLFPEKMAMKLTEAGLFGYFASVDSLKELTADPDSSRKSITGYSMLKKLKRMGVPLLAANVVIHSFNMKEIPEIVKHLSNEGFYINLCTIQHTTNPNKEFSNNILNESLLIPPEREREVKALALELIELKKQGFRIINPEIYMEGMPTYGIHCNWQCRNPIQLRVDADGGLMLCNEFRSELAENYNITSLTEETYSQFLRDWYRVRAKTNCEGCYWSCFIQAEENIRKGKLEFDYLYEHTETHPRTEFTTRGAERLTLATHL